MSQVGLIRACLFRHWNRDSVSKDEVTSMTLCDSQTRNVHFPRLQFGAAGLKVYHALVSTTRNPSRAHTNLPYVDPPRSGSGPPTLENSTFPNAALAFLTAWFANFPIMSVTSMRICFSLLFVVQVVFALALLFVSELPESSQNAYAIAHSVWHVLAYSLCHSFLLESRPRPRLSPN